MHFVALCPRYPEFRFTCEALRATRPRKAVVSFEGGKLDTHARGFTVDEAGHIHASLQHMVTAPPLYGREITVIPAADLNPDAKKGVLRQ